MSYVAISGQVIDRVVGEAREHPDEQVVGVLLGGQLGGTIVIEDAATGAAESNSTHATLTGDSIARIADDILNKRIRGNIVGWYHSHVRGGVFMSETDVETQLKLQQFSPLVTAMVVDTRTGESGFFRADPRTKKAVSIPPQNVKTEIAPPAPTPSPTNLAMYPQAPAPGAAMPISTRTILLAVVLITLAVTGGIVALIYYRGPSAATNLAITHTPPKPPFTIAHPITFDANVTGTYLSNVTLAYRIIEQSETGPGFVVGDLVKVPMLLRAAGKDVYSYTIPSSEIAGVYVNYYISAFDTSGNVVRSDIYNLEVGDFKWHDERTELTVVRTVTGQVSLGLDRINAFNRAVTIRIPVAAPLGVRITPASTQVVPPNPVILVVTSVDTAEIVQDYELEVDAIYSPPGVSAVQIIRLTKLVLTVTDFDLDVSPTYREVERGEEVTYSLTLKVFEGFTAPNGFQVSVTGLPDLTSWELVLIEYKVASDLTDTFTYNLRIKTETGTNTGTYLFAVKISAGPVSHTKSNIQLEITY